MGTDAQNEANHRNAQQSTGPRTEAGKKRASLNARTHGLTAADAVIPGESEGDFEAYRAALWAEWEPKDADQAFEAELAINDGWRLLRAQRLESGLFAYLIGTTLQKKAWDDARREGIEAAAEEEADFRQPTRERQKVFDRIEAARSLLRDPKATLGAVYEKDAATSAAFDKLSRHEGTLRKRRLQTLQRLERLQQRDQDPPSDTRHQR